MTFSRTLIRSAALSMLQVREVLLLSVVLHGVLTSGHVILNKVTWIEGESVGSALSCTLSV